MNYSEALQSAIEILRKAKRVLVLTGAGISAESGVPTFRGGGGSTVWRGMPFDQLSSARLVEDDLPLLWDWFDYRRTKLSQCDPNAAHFTLAKASKSPRFKSFKIVTQNIDGLHQAADTDEVIELHGSIWRARCLSCGRTASIRVISQDERPPICRDCMDSMRPDVVLFGEALPMTEIFLANEFAESCDVCLVIGTSAQVYPAAAIPNKAISRGATVIEINPEVTDFTDSANISLRERATKVIPDLFAFLEEPFDLSEDIEKLDVEIRLDQIRFQDEVESEPPALPDVDSESPSLRFLLDDEFSSNRELIFEVAYAKASALMYLFTPDDEQPFLFVCGTGVAADGETIAEWEPELITSVKDGIKTIAGGDQIFYTEGLYINPAYRDEIRSYLQEVRDGLGEAERRKLELFQRPTADDWIRQTEERMRAFDALEAKENDVQEDTAPVEEPLSDRHFLLFWRDTSVTAQERSERSVNLISSNQIKEVSRGDTLWIATLDQGELVLCGRMRVGEIVDRFVAEERFGKDNVWKSDWFAVAHDADECELITRLHLGDRALEIRFNEDEDDRFTLIDGRISRRQTRKLRELTHGSVQLLESIWSGEEDETGFSEDELDPKVIAFPNVVADQSSPDTVDNAKLKLFEGCLLGGAVGDALGAAVEFDSLRRIKERFGETGLTGYATAYGRHGAITDDTQMTLFTAEGLIRAQARQSSKGICYPAKIIYHAYLRWLQTQGRMIDDEDVTRYVYEESSWLRDTTEINSLRAPGNTCLSALESGRMGTLEEAINNSKGCGGIMRVAPVGLIALDPFRLGAEAAAITHGHPTGYLAAGVLSLLISKLVSGNTLLEAIEHAVYEELPRHDGHEETLAACDKAIRLAKIHLGADIETGTEVVPFGPEAVESLGSGWIAEEALAISIYCALVHENDFERAILLSVNHSGDSDSTGSITGNILGARLGVDSIPQRWLDELEMVETIKELSHDLLIGFREGPEWARKYPGI